MNHWWRAYNTAASDPKLGELTDWQHRCWFQIMCMASDNDGALPALKHVAYTLRVKPERAAEVISQLHAAGLLDKTETGFVPHNWDGRQYKSDTSTPRVKRFRNAKRNVSPDVERNAPEQSRADTEQNSAANAAGADAPVDHRKRLFDEGLSKLATMTGKGPDACRSFVGKCLKASGDDAVTVLGLIEDAERNQVANASSWIASRLKPTENFNGKTGSKVIQAADDLRRKIASFDGPASGDFLIRDGESAAAPRLLPHG